MAQYQRRIKAGLRWFYKFNFKTVTYRSQCIYLTKGEAKKAERIEYDRLDEELRNPNAQKTIWLKDVINERLDYVKIKKSHAYYRENIRCLKILINELGNIALAEVTKASIENLLLKKSELQQEKGGDNYVVNGMLRSYKAMFGYIIAKHELTLKNPCDGIQFFRVTKKMKYIPFDEDIQAVLELCDDGQRLLIETVKDTGARINEALRICGNDIHEKDIILYTRKSKNSDLVPRKVPKPEYFKDIRLETNEKLFSSWKEQPRFLEDAVKKLEQKNWSWHNLRHLFASRLSRAGKPLFEIMMLLGHSNLKTTQNYLQLLP